METAKHILIFAVAFAAALYVFNKIKPKCGCGCSGGCGA